MRPRALFIAPEDFEREPVNLGAATKIAALVRILDRLGHEVHYVDSSHWQARWAGAVHGRPSRVAGTPVTLWRPPMVPHRKLGKLLNVLGAAGFARRLQGLRPAFTWIYNAYAFEAAVAHHLHAQGVPFVLEIEDLPLARPRGLNPKPHWDQQWFKRVLPQAGLVSFVNQRLLDEHRPEVRRSLLLPSVLRREFDDLAGRRRFADAQTTRIGYFGGLSHEKGAGLLLEALARWPADSTLVVTGQGDLGPAFAAAAATPGSRLEYHGAVPSERLAPLMASCDAIVNPHRAIADMGDGVFPFKVCEALAAGALLISTELPPIAAPLAGAVLFFDGRVQGLLDAVVAARAFDSEHRSQIDALARHIAGEYGESAVAARLAPLLAALTAPGPLPTATPQPRLARR
ncbi:MAG: glycosyltransferase [Rubrivivax sp.]|jgi:glycosyltransferase involved in cell wall biosynthesis|nr:glycosyltransferase [Rubrivivax sp.]